jgi:hypothetical protein
MKNKLLFGICMLSAAAFSQDYIPLLDNTSWNVRIDNFGGSNYAWIEEGETETIDGTDWLKHTDVVQWGDLYLREDVAERRVYRLNEGTEELLFDFSLEEGDLVTLANGVQYEVTLKDSVSVMEGRKRVRLYLDPEIDIYSETWIEGVGNAEHPLVPDFDRMSDPAYTTYCSYTDGNPMYNFGLASNGTPIDCPEPTASVTAHVLHDIAIFPNPVKDEARITTGHYFDNASLTLFNALGQQVYHAENINGSEHILERSSLNAGIYFAELEQDGKKLASKKLVIAD